MFSSAHRGQIEPLPALLAVAIFAIGISLYGVTLSGVPNPTGPEITDATVSATAETLGDGSTVVPARMDQLDGTLPPDVGVTLRADGQVWEYNDPPADPDRTRIRHVLVRTATGEQPGLLRVSA
ncbi:hypothetical protein HTSR_1463 [Halodesulfurarchaeum formicicum]|uniref:Uncharacterized protein n=1 Tax=Halodesulfurarchaeum formicicum TaxID=1873524 RepID=A0A1D8S5K9_9EURY|nr:hypothetical protein [Halodesulfurarchaeum formicicum]AOW80639.1 hypothetical protein HTSR_1463 [Halodesulfurarchaeum formicicum]